VQTVYLAPLIPIQYFRKIPNRTDHRSVELNIAPVRVASTTSPEPIYSPHHTNAGPTSAKTIKPFGGVFICVSFIIGSFNRYSPALHVFFPNEMTLQKQQLPILTKFR